jgi:hypothetical protein
MEILAFMPPTLIGSALVVLLLPRFSLKGVWAIFTVCLGSGIGLGLTSSTIFLWLAWIGRPGAAYHVFEISSAILLAAMAAYRIQRRRSAGPDQFRADGATPDAPIRWLKRVVVILLLISSGSFGLKAFIEDPYGTIDVRIVWNYRARWLFRGGEQWQHAFYSPVARDAEYEDDKGHAADYPLLITASVYRGWEVIGNDHFAIPIMIAGIFTFGTYLLLYASLALLRNRNQGYLGVLLLMVSTQFLHLGTDQYGDIPLSFFILSTLALFALKDRLPNVSPPLLVLAGFTTACAAWTKNEGVLFFVLVLLVYFVGRVWRKAGSELVKDFGYFLLGLLPIGGTLLYYKIGFAPRNDMINIPTLKDTAFHLFDLERYLISGSAILKKIFTFNEYIIFLLAAYFFLSGLDRTGSAKIKRLPHVALIVLMLCGYLLAYVITPYELEWHIDSSIRRLIIQIWPAWVFIFFFCVRGPELTGREIED